MIAIFGYGITSRAMTAYGTIAFDGRAFFLKVISPVYYFVLGDFDEELSSLEGKKKEHRNSSIAAYIFFSKAKPDASTSIATLVLFSFHMLFVNILLLNLLISLFTYVNKEKRKISFE
jgi:hypothetical protein